MQYEFSSKVSPQEISELRKSVGWNSMEIKHYCLSIRNLGLILHF